MTYSYGVVIVNLEYISYLFPVTFIADFEQVIVCRAATESYRTEKFSVRICLT